MTRFLKYKSRVAVITLSFCIFMLFCFCTIVYSAFSSTMNINGVGYSRVEADVRITDFSIKDTTNSSVSMYESFGKDFISSEVSLKSNSSITYNLEITNYGSVDVGIFSISGLPSDVNYSIEGYNLKDKICDQNGKCNNYTVKTYSLKIYTTGSSYEGVVNLQFDFRKFHKISYIGFSGSYIDSVIDGEEIKLDFSGEELDDVSVESNCNTNFVFSNFNLTITNILCDIKIEAIKHVIYEYSYTGNYQTFTAPYDGVYKIELWGASGYPSDNTGKGGYVAGEISLMKDTKLYVYVGGAGKQHISSNSGGWNGGGSGDNSGHNENERYGGGGATDVRLTSGTWNNFSSLKSRIMVAGAGGTFSQDNGVSYGSGDAGGLVGYRSSDLDEFAGYGGTQTAGGAGVYSSTYVGSGKQGGFGYGGAGYSYASGAGSGYYGGGGGSRDVTDGAGGGGSSFISGHAGCDAVKSSSVSSNIYHSGQSVHYSGYEFENTVMIDGKGYRWYGVRDSDVIGMPTYDGNGNMIGNIGNGYAKITFVDPEFEYKVKYVDILGEYQSKIVPGDSLVVDFGENAPLSLIVSNVTTNITDYTYENGILTINNVTSNLIIKSNNHYNYSYSGSVKTFTATYTGIYKIRLWGAQGASYDTNLAGGLGGYTSGNIFLNKGDKIYVAVGGVGSGQTTGYNGGGGCDDVDFGRAGGGSTDVRLNSTDVLSRIMVAAGGGGAAQRGEGYGDGPGGAGGGLIGITGTSINVTNSYGHGYGLGGEQTKGGLLAWIKNGNISLSEKYNNTSVAKGVFQTGGTGAAGGGSGYYGGAGAYHGGAGGGSSFVSGHNGCNAISGSSTTSNIVHTGQPSHYSGYVFTDTEIIDGNGYKWTNSIFDYPDGMPTTDLKSVMAGNSENGYAKISLLAVKN